MTEEKPFRRIWVPPRAVRPIYAQGQGAANLKCTKWCHRPIGLARRPERAQIIVYVPTFPILVQLRPSKVL